MRHLSFSLYLIALLVYALLFSSCSSARYYSYDIKLISPLKSDRLFFENDTFSISFEFRQYVIWFEIYNKLGDGIKINWDELSISQNGKAKRIVHKETGVLNVTEIQPPTTIPPKSKLEDVLYTTDAFSVGVNQLYKKYTEKIMYPKTDGGYKFLRNEILQLKGQNVMFFLPYYLRGVYQSKTFEFSIHDIREFKNEKERKLYLKSKQ